jgi:hypothetical protein
LRCNMWIRRKYCAFSSGKDAPAAPQPLNRHAMIRVRVSLLHLLVLFREFSLHQVFRVLAQFGDLFRRNEAAHDQNNRLYGRRGTPLQKRDSGFLRSGASQSEVSGLPVVGERVPVSVNIFDVSSTVDGMYQTYCKRERARIPCSYFRIYACS